MAQKWTTSWTKVPDRVLLFCLSGWLVCSLAHSTTLNGVHNPLAIFFEIYNTILCMLTRYSFELNAAYPVTRWLNDWLRIRVAKKNEDPCSPCLLLSTLCRIVGNGDCTSSVTHFYQLMYDEWDYSLIALPCRPSRVWSNFVYSTI